MKKRRFEINRTYCRPAKRFIPLLQSREREKEMYMHVYFRENADVRIKSISVIETREE